MESDCLLLLHVAPPPSLAPLLLPLLQPTQKNNTALLKKNLQGDEKIAPRSKRIYVLIYVFC